MTIKVGTIQELSGIGLEILVDGITREQVLGTFLDGQMIASVNHGLNASPAPRMASPAFGEEKTVITAA